MTGDGWGTGKGTDMVGKTLVQLKHPYVDQFHEELQQFLAYVLEPFRDLVVHFTVADRDGTERNGRVAVVELGPLLLHFLEQLHPQVQIVAETLFGRLGVEVPERLGVVSVRVSVRVKG